MRDLLSVLARFARLAYVASVVAVLFAAACVVGWLLYALASGPPAPFPTDRPGAAAVIVVVAALAVAVFVSDGRGVSYRVTRGLRLSPKRKGK